MMIDTLSLIAGIAIAPGGVWNPIPVTPPQAMAPKIAVISGPMIRPMKLDFSPEAMMRPMELIPGVVMSIPKLKMDVKPEPKREARSMAPDALTAVFQAIETLPKVTGESKKATLPLPVVTSGQSAIKVANKKPAPKPIEEKLCNVVAAGADLSDVLNMLSEQAQVNVLLVSPVESKINVRLLNVKLIEAMNHLAAVTGMQFIKTGNAFVMGTKEKLTTGYPREWAKREAELKKQEEADSEAEAKSKPPVGNTDANQSGASSTAKTPEDPVVSRILHVSHVDPTSLVESLKALFQDKGLLVAAGPKPKTPDISAAGSTGGGDTAGTMQTSGERFPRSLILRGPQSVITQAIDTVNQLDVLRQQVSIAVTIHDVNDDALRDLGLTYTPGGTTISESANSGLNFGTFARTPLSFNVGIRLAESKDKAKLLASPNVTVMDQEKAFVLIGNRINLPKLERLDNNGSPVYTSVEYRAGVYLQVAANISEDGEITLTLYPQVSTITSTNEINGAAYPNIATREAQTTMTVRSGETVVMGGLLRDEEIKEMERVPVLGQIPFFGELFTRRRNQKTKSQVIITITPTLVKKS
jgi:hypothetical protein